MELNKIRKMNDKDLMRFLNNVSQRNAQVCCKCGSVTFKENRISIYTYKGCENKQFKDNWNKLKKYMIDTEQIYKKSDDKYIKDMHEIGIRHAYQTILYKMYELEQGSDSNE